jgi:hypothetical protein
MDFGSQDPAPGLLQGNVFRPKGKGVGKYLIKGFGKRNHLRFIIGWGNACKRTPRKL